MKTSSYNILCLVLLIFLVSNCTEPDEPTTEVIPEIPVSEKPDVIPETPVIEAQASIYKLIDYIWQDSIPSKRIDTLFGIDEIRIDAKLKNFSVYETIDYSEVEIKQTEGTGTGGKMLFTNKGTYLEIKLSIDRITTKTVPFGYDVYYKGKKIQHFSHDLFQSWIGYTLQVMHAEYHEDGIWKANIKEIIEPTEPYRTFYTTVEKFALYKGSTKVSPAQYFHNYNLDSDWSQGNIQMEPGEYPEYYHVFGADNGKFIKFPINLNVDGTILNIWAGKYIKAHNYSNGEKAEIKIYRNGTKWTYDITFKTSVGRSITKWEGGEASLSTIPVTLEQYCPETKSQLKHLGTISLHYVTSESGIIHNPLTGAVYLWLKDGEYYVTPEYNPCFHSTPNNSQIVMSLEMGG